MSRFLFFRLCKPPKGKVFCRRSDRRELSGRKIGMV